MEVKHLIIFMERQKLKFEGVYPDEIDEVISLLQQGERYQQIVGELKEFYGNGIVENEGGFGVQLKNLIEILEGKYFPKE